MSDFWTVDPDATDADAPDGAARIVDAAVAQDSSAITDTPTVWSVLPRERVTLPRRLWFLLQSLLHLLARLVAGVTALARDFCAGLYAGYPVEAVEEEFAVSMAALGRDEE